MDFKPCGETPARRRPGRIENGGGGGGAGKGGVGEANI